MDEEFRRLERAAAHDAGARLALRQARRRRGLCPAGAHSLGFSVDEDQFRVRWTPPSLMGGWSWDLDSAMRHVRFYGDPVGTQLVHEHDVLGGLASILERWARDGRPSCNVAPRVTVLEDQTGIMLTGTCVEGCAGNALVEPLVLDPEARWGSRVPLRLRITKWWRDTVEHVAELKPPGQRLTVELRTLFPPFPGEFPRFPGEFSARARDRVVLYAEEGEHVCPQSLERDTVTRYAAWVRVEGDRQFPRPRPCPGCGVVPRNGMTERGPRGWAFHGDD